MDNNKTRKSSPDHLPNIHIGQDDVSLSQESAAYLQWSAHVERSQNMVIDNSKLCLKNEAEQFSNEIAEQN